MKTFLPAPVVLMCLTRPTSPERAESYAVDDQLHPFARPFAILVLQLS